MLSSQELAANMAAFAISPEAQLRQTEFRRRLVKNWQIAEGSRVLEVGCGQGDTTIVLADAVGETGHVTAVDVADPSYGAPVSVGNSTQTLKESLLGERIDFHFNFDGLNHANTFAPDSFDVVVLSHCTWYFESLERLEKTLARVHSWAPKLCLSEWDMEPRSIDQLGHFLAVLIQGQVESFKNRSDANVRTPYSRERLKDILQMTGWDVASDNLVEASSLDDARWEIAATLAEAEKRAGVPEMPPKLEALIASQVDVLQRLSVQSGNMPLPSYSVVAYRHMP